MVDASKERLARGSEPMKQEPLTIQIGRRIVLREARRMRDPMRRRTGRGSWPTLDKLLFLAIFLGFTGRGLLARSKTLRFHVYSLSMLWNLNKVGHFNFQYVQF